MGFTLPLNTPEYVNFLLRSGYFWDPNFPEAHNVTSADVPKLSLNDRVVKEATMSFQASDANFDEVSKLVHSRLTNPDGNAGPVTAFMSQAARCPIPDYLPPAGAAIPTYSDDLTLQRIFEDILESMKRFQAASRETVDFATGSGSWPVPGCDPTRPLKAKEHSVRVNLNTSRTPSNIKSYLDDSIKLCRACAAEQGLAVRWVLDGNVSDAEFDVQWESIAGNVIGYCYFPDPGTCNQKVTCRLDTNYDAGTIMLANLMTHEYLGHGVGLQHTRGGIMNPSILRIDPLTWKGDVSESIYRRYFGGQPIDDGGSPPPPPTDPPGDPTYHGVLIYEGKQIKLRIIP